MLKVFILLISEVDVFRISKFMLNFSNHLVRRTCMNRRVEKLHNRAPTLVRWPNRLWTRLLDKLDSWQGLSRSRHTQPTKVKLYSIIHRLLFIILFNFMMLGILWISTATKSNTDLKNFHKNDSEFVHLVRRETFSINLMLFVVNFLRLIHTFSFYLWAHKIQNLYFIYVLLKILYSTKNKTIIGNHFTWNAA